MSLKVLLADDSMTAQNMGRKILSESGYDVTTVSNGAAAVKKIAEVKPDLVILDIYMPGYTGLEVCERVRANFDTANLPVLLTVGKMEPYRAEDGAKVRADGVIVKPFEATDLLAVVKKMAERVPTAPARRVAMEEAEPEEESQHFSQPEPAMPAQVEVPSELAVAPALAMEEFETPQAAPAAFAAPSMDWSAPVEMPAESHATAEASHSFAEAPWSFDVPAVTEPAPENIAEVSTAPNAEIEFTSAPQAADVATEQVAELEPEKPEAPLTVEPIQDADLASAQEASAFTTSFGDASVEEPKAMEAAAAEGSWNGWAHAEPTPEGAHRPEGVIDDFEAKVAAAMSGFSTEAAEPAKEAPSPEIAATPVDDFEARVAAAMSGFATEPIAASEPAAPEAHAEETHQEAEPTTGVDDFEARVAAAMSGFSTSETEATQPMAESHAEVAEPVVEAVPEVNEAPAPPSTEDFDTRLAEAMSAFDTTPEPVTEAAPEAKPQDETQEFDVPELPKPAINLNETMVLPQEAVLSLEEEMKRAMTPAAVEAEPEAEVEAPAPAMTAPETISWEPPQAEAHEPEAEPSGHHAEPMQANVPEEFDPAHVAEEVQAVLHQEAPAETHVAPSNGLGGEKLASAVHRAIERLKPQLIAEIVKELKGE